MGSRTVWILLVFVLLLGGVTLWQLGRERSNVFATDRPLFEGVRPERVQSVHIDHLERGLQITMTRDADGSWQIVDPLAFPAEGGVLDRLLEVVSKNRAIPVDEPDLAALSLAPPRAVLELVETLPGGERKLRLELGEKDLDGKYVFARVDGQVVRTLLNLDSTLERDLSGWRQRRIMNVDPAGVVELRRYGRIELDPGQGLSDLELEAGLLESGWCSTRPWTARLDPGAVGALLTNACYLQARTFLADSAAQIPAFGFEAPDLRLVLTVTDGSEVTLLLKREPRAESWHCMLEGSTHVFRVEDISVVFLTLRADGFIDTQLVRAARDEVERIELRRSDGTLSLRRDGKLWKLARKEDGASSSEVPADSEAVLDLLGAIENARAARFLFDEQVPAFTASDSALGLACFSRGAEHAIEFGSAREASPGVPGRLFRRAGDNLVGVVEARIAALAARKWTELVDRQLIKLPELGIAGIEITCRDFRRKFARDASTGRWSPEGVDVEAPKAFLKCVERLLSLRADSLVDLDTPFELQDPWQILVIDGGNARTSYRLGSLEVDPAQQGFDDGRVRGIVTSSGLAQDLALIP